MTTNAAVTTPGAAASSTDRVAAPAIEVRAFPDAFAAKNIDRTTAAAIHGACAA